VLPCTLNSAEYQKCLEVGGVALSRLLGRSRFATAQIVIAEARVHSD
jgi:hypothetical protein